MTKRLALFRAAVGVITLGLSALFGAPPSGQAGDPGVQAQRKALHSRVDRVRGALQADAADTVARSARFRLAQWYNYSPWLNEWSNYWRNW